MSVLDTGSLNDVRGPVFRIGETRAISRTLVGNEYLNVSAATCTIYDSSGSAVVTAATAQREAQEQEIRISYLWNTTGRSAGEYTWVLSLTFGSETLLEHGAVTLVPVVTKFTRWQRRIQDWLKERGFSETATACGLDAVMPAALQAVRLYERDRPQRANHTATLTNGTYEYALPSTSGAEWKNEFSRIAAFEYPVDDPAGSDQGTQVKRSLEPDEYAIDELRSKWRFTRLNPGTSETARFEYTYPHVLSHTADTVPDIHFDAVAQYAAGSVLMSLANRSAGSGAPGIAAEVVNYRTKQQEYRQQAMEMQKQARALWTEGNASASAWGQWRYLDGHGHYYGF